jgi:hypothetical protein
MRELKIYTGRAGVEMIDRAIKQDLEIRNMLDYLDHLQGTKVLTSEEKDSLKK